MLKTVTEVIDGGTKVMGNEGGLRDQIRKVGWAGENCGRKESNCVGSSELLNLDINWTAVSC